MQILSYQYNGTNEATWKFSKVEFGKVNLLVGDTGTGKTKFLNTIFNLGLSAVKKELGHSGSWDIVTIIGKNKYRWVFETVFDNDQNVKVVTDNLYSIDDNEKEHAIVLRNSKSFLFNNTDLPKLSQRESSISLLQHEKDINPIFKGFGSIMRRSFFENVLQQNAAYQPMSPNLLTQLRKEKDIEKIFHYADLNLNIKLFLLSENFKNIFQKIVVNYKAVFPFIADIKMLELSDIKKDISSPGITPVFCFKEKNMSNWIDSGEMSSGMLKVLIILTDVFLLPEGGIYLIDEYENSLGMNAIDFLPSFLLSYENSSQFIITSHHPYIINKIPVENWYIFHRKGTETTIQYGDTLKSRFGKSKQQAFIQLINDPFFSKGVE